MSERVHVWFGIGDGECVGPIEGHLQADGKVHIVDPGFLSYMGMVKPWVYTCFHLKPGEGVGNDDFAWTRLSDPMPEHNPKFW